jgi:hypothetical protein
MRVYEYKEGDSNKIVMWTFLLGLYVVWITEIGFEETGRALARSSRIDVIFITRRDNFHNGLLAALEEKSFRFNLMHGGRRGQLNDGL